MRCPTGKRRYADELGAKIALTEVRSADALRPNRRGRAKSPCRVYPCPKCKGWHLTSLPRSGGDT